MTSIKLEDIDKPPRQGQLSGGATDYFAGSGATLLAAKNLRCAQELLELEWTA